MGAFKSWKPLVLMISRLLNIVKGLSKIIVKSYKKRTTTKQAWNFWKLFSRFVYVRTLNFSFNWIFNGYHPMSAQQNHKNEHRVTWAQACRDIVITAMNRGIPTQQAICFKGRITNNWFLCFEQNRWLCSTIVLIGVLGFKVLNRILCRQIEVSWKETSIWNLPNY